MHAAGRLASLRLTALAGLGASAALTHDALHPERAFCPLERACDRARQSALGDMFGVPTSVVGVLAFGAFVLLTLLPVEAAWRLARFAGAAAAAAGLAFLAYQHFVLGTYCPLCLGADGAGILLGILALTWRAPPVLRSGNRLPREPGASQAAWLAAGVLAVGLPLAWPRAQEPAWVEIDPQEDRASDASAPHQELVTSVADGGAKSPPPSSLPTPIPPVDAASGIDLGTPPPPAPPDAAPAPSPLPDGPKGTARKATVAHRSPASSPIRIVEYLNAYCAHCRATHQRLEKVIAEGGRPVRRRRVLTWASAGYPAWARAVAYAETMGCEERLFEELMVARGESLPELYAAARRAGLDEAGLAAALRDPTPPPRLVRDRQLALSAALRGLPTLDIGRRRLMGEQSEGELREALRAASAPDPTSTARR